MIDERDGVTYPDGIQAKDGTIYIIYDYNRTPEGVIHMATFREEDVRAGKPVTDKVGLRVAPLVLQHHLSQPSYLLAAYFAGDPTSAVFIKDLVSAIAGAPGRSGCGSASTKRAIRSRASPR